MIQSEHMISMIEANSEQLCNSDGMCTNEEGRFIPFNFNLPIPLEVDSDWKVMNQAISRE